MQLNVMHQVNNLAIGGVETYVYRLCKYSNENVCVFSHKEGMVSEWLEEADIPVYYKDKQDIARIIEDEKIDILVMHTGSYLPDYAHPLKKKFPKLKFVTVLHTVYSSPDTWVDKIVAVSRAIQDVNPGSILIYPGVDRRHRFVVGEVTRLAPYKYLEHLIEIASIVSNKEPNVLFRIIGEEAQDAHGYRKELEKKIKDNGLENNVEFLGLVDYIDYGWFDAFIHLVGDEAYPVTLLEAVNANLPTFTYSRRGTAEMAFNNLYKLDNIDQIAAKLLEIIWQKPKHINDCANEFSEVYRRLW